MVTKLKTAFIERKYFYEKYDKIFKDYEKYRIIKKVHSDEIPQDLGKVHYLSQRPVLREVKETTKIRAVFDESYGNKGPSLKDRLYPSPNLLAKIFDILLKVQLLKKH